MAVAAGLAALIGLRSLLGRARAAARRRRGGFIDAYRFHPQIDRKLAERHPQLQPAQRARVLQGLRDYFHVCNQAGRRFVSMPSQVVDDAWHAFILDTRAYALFCRNAFGRFLHHVPAEAMTAPTRAQHGIRRAWKLACLREGLSPRAPERLPLLFALDAELGIANGFHYLPDCSRAGFRGDRYCASHIGCGGGSSGCSSGCGADGDGGSGCGGGGCGGGGGD